jgi:U3 small nucleolar ribonucleoprotein protein IMP4
VMEHRGEPDGLIVSHLPFGPTAHFNMSGCVMRHDLPKDTLGNMSEAYPHLVFDGFESKLGIRIQNILKFLFPVPKPDAKRVLTFSNQKDTIEFRHHTYAVAKNTNPNKTENIELSECGPRFALRCFQVTLGVLGDSSAQNEWVLRPYMNTAKKRKIL